MDEKQQFLRKIAKLEQENQRLRELLTQYGIVDMPPVQSEALTGQHAMLLYTLFRGRKDVYSRRSINKDGHGVYYPVCENFWKSGMCPKRDGKKVKCAECSNRVWAPLSQRVLLSHLQGQKEDGADVVGIYPMLPDETCNFLVFDFDNHDGEALDWKNEVDTMRQICTRLEVPCMVERSRSGNGAHIWLLFTEPVPAETARKFGAALLTKGAEFVNIKTFQSYDRMLPAQDHMPQGGLGNLIALPLQGLALQKGNSAFVNEQWESYPNQWEYLRNARKISKEFVEESIKAWTPQGLLGVLSTAETETEKATPWKKEKFSFHKEDISGELHVVLADQIYVDTENLKPRFQNMLRRMASFQNPAFFRNIAMGYSIKGISRILCCYQDVDGYIALPRGKWEKLQICLEAADISMAVTDERQKGHTIQVDFRATLYPEQQLAVDAMLVQDTGMLSAATAFGKTAVGAYMIAERKVNTLILVHNREIMKNWVEDLQKFLDIQEECPEYVTPKGRHKRRKSVIGTLYAAHDSITGIIDVAMVSSLGKPGEISDIVKNYGMVIMDECHHGAALTIEAVLREISAKYVYGLTATPKRDDGLEQKVNMQFGPIRHRFTAKDKAQLQGIRHIVIPRFTRLTNLGSVWKINEAYKALKENDSRNQLIVDDALCCVSQGKTPLILTKFKDHAETLRQLLDGKVLNLFVLQGGRSTKEREAIRAALRDVPENESLAVIAIGKYIGEGFNLPRLDTMLLAAPIAWEGNVEQYAGRLHRDYEGKAETVIYDYVDVHVQVLEKMYHKRLRAYKKIGYEIGSLQSEAQITTDMIFDAASYQGAFVADLVNAKKQIIVASPGIGKKGVQAFETAIEMAQMTGVEVTVLTMDADSYPEAAQEQSKQLQESLMQKGIHVRTYPFLYYHFAVVDEEIVWYGNMNLLSTPKPEDSMLRLESKDLAQELLLELAKQKVEQPV